MPRLPRLAARKEYSTTLSVLSGSCWPSRASTRIPRGSSPAHPRPAGVAPRSMQRQQPPPTPPPSGRGSRLGGQCCLRGQCPPTMSLIIVSVAVLVHYETTCVARAAGSSGRGPATPCQPGREDALEHGTAMARHGVLALLGRWTLATPRRPKASTRQGCAHLRH